MVDAKDYTAEKLGRWTLTLDEFMRLAHAEQGLRYYENRSRGVPRVSPPPAAEADNLELKEQEE